MEVVYRNKRSQYRLVYEEGKGYGIYSEYGGEVVSDWFSKVDESGILSDESDYYVGYKGGRGYLYLIYDRDNFLVSGKVIHTDGLVKGESDYVVVELEEGGSALYSREDFKKPIAVYKKIDVRSGLIKGKSKYFLAMNEEGLWALFSVEEPDKPLSKWWSWISLDGVVSNESKYYLVRREEDGKMAIFHIDDMERPISKWYSVIKENGLVKGLDDYYFVSEGDFHAVFHKDNNQIPVAVNEHKKGQRTIMLHPYEYDNLKRKVDFYVLKREDGKDAIFNFKTIPNKVLSGWGDVVTIGLLEGSGYYVLKRSDGQSAIFHVSDPAKPVSIWSKSGVGFLVSGLLYGRSPYYVVHRDGYQAIYHKDSDKPVSKWFKIHSVKQMLVLSSSGVVQGEGEYYRAPVKNNKQILFHIKDKENPVSKAGIIEERGVLKGRSPYYILTREDGKQAIFHVNDKDNPVSRWVDFVWYDGMVDGFGDYYMVIEGKDVMVFHKDDKEHPILKNRTLVSNIGILGGRGDYFLNVEDDKIILLDKSLKEVWQFNNSVFLYWDNDKRIQSKEFFIVKDRRTDLGYVFKIDEPYEPILKNVNIRTFLKNPEDYLNKGQSFANKEALQHLKSLLTVRFLSADEIPLKFIRINKDFHLEIDKQKIKVFKNNVLVADDIEKVKIQANQLLLRIDSIDYEYSINLKPESKINLR